MGPQGRAVPPGTLCILLLPLLMSGWGQREVRGSLIPTPTNTHEVQFKVCSNNKTVSCSHQLSAFVPDVTDKDCVVEFINTTTNTDCVDMKHSYVMAAPEGVVPTLYASAYNKFGIKTYSLINVTIPGSKWHNVVMRIQQKCANVTICRRFRIAKEFDVSTIPYFNCPWRNVVFGKRNEICNVHIEFFETDLKVRKEYLFTMPDPYNIDERRIGNASTWTVFMYWDVSRADQIKLTFQKAPKKFGIKEYWVFLKDNTTGEILHMQNVTEQDQEPDLLYPKKPHPSALKGIFQGYVEMISEECKVGKCRSYAALLTLHDSSESSYMAITVALIVVSAIIMGGVVGMCIGKRANSHLASKGRKKVLLVYRVSHDKHLECVRKLKEHLVANCLVDVFLADDDLPKTGKDPHSWFIHAMDVVDAVIVVASPRLPEVHDAVYRKLHKIALTMLRDSIANRSSKNFDIMCVIFPYCTAQDLPKDVKYKPRFKLPQQFNSMLSRIHKVGRLSVFNLNLQNMPGSSLMAYEHGRQLEVSWTRLRDILRRMKSEEEIASITGSMWSDEDEGPGQVDTNKTSESDEGGESDAAQKDAVSLGECSQEREVQDENADRSFARKIHDINLFGDQAPLAEEESGGNSLEATIEIDENSEKKKAGEVPDKKSIYTLNLMGD